MMALRKTKEKHMTDQAQKPSSITDTESHSIASEPVANSVLEAQATSDMSGPRRKMTVIGGQLAQLRNDLENSLCQRIDVNEIGDSITWGMSTTGQSATDPRTGSLTDPRNNMTAPSWSNLFHQWMGDQFFRMSAPTSAEPGKVVYSKSLDLWPSSPSFTLSAFATSEGELANTNATLRRYIDYVTDGKSISWNMYGDEFTFVYSQLGNGAEYELFVDGVSQGRFTTAGAAAFKMSRTHSLSLGKHKVQIVKRGNLSSTLRIETVRINKTLNFRNNGIIGRSTANWLPGAGLLDSAVTTSDSYLLIMLGTNDRAQTNQPTSPSRITENLFAILSWLQTQRPLARPILLCANEADQDVGATYFYDMHDVRGAISVAAHSKAVDFVDFYEVTRAALTAGLPYLSDGLHPNDLGHFLMSRVIIDAVCNAELGAFGNGIPLSSRPVLDLNDPSLAGPGYAGSLTLNKPSTQPGFVVPFQQGDGRAFQWYLPLNGDRPIMRVCTATGAWISREMAMRAETLQVAGGTMSGVFKTATYTLATLPSVSGNAAALIWVSDLTDGAFHCYCDGAVWRRMDTKAIAS